VSANSTLETMIYFSHHQYNFCFFDSYLQIYSASAFSVN